jgi:broad specificity phosphatase PhoE
LQQLADEEPIAVQEWLENPDSTRQNGESLRELLARAGSWMKEQADRERIIAVTHPAVIRAAAVHVLTAGPGAFWRIDVPPLATLSVNGAPGRWSIRLR